MSLGLQKGTRNSHSLLRRVGVPGVNGTGLPVIFQCENVAFNTGVGADKGFVVCVDNPLWRSLRAHVEINVPIGIEGVRRLSPSANVNIGSIGIVAAQEQANVVDALLKDAVLGAGACDIIAPKWHGGEELRIPVSGILKYKLPIVSLN